MLGGGEIKQKTRQRKDGSCRKHTMPVLQPLLQPGAGLHSSPGLCSFRQPLFLYHDKTHRPQWDSEHGQTQPDAEVCKSNPACSWLTSNRHVPCPCWNAPWCEPSSNTHSVYTLFNNTPVQMNSCHKKLSSSDSWNDFGKLLSPPLRYGLD